MSQSKQKTLVSNQEKIAELAKELERYADAPLEVEEYGKIQNLRDKLDYELVLLEEEGQHAKIRNMTKVLAIMKVAKERQAV